MSGIPLPFVRTNQWMIVSTVLAALLFSQPWILVIPLLVGIISLSTGKNPAFWLARPFLSKPLSQYLAEDPDQQRFNQWISVICLAVSLIAFSLGWTTVGTVFAVMVALAAFIAILGFCIGCFIRYQFLQWKHRHQKR
ncbi:DUF4395 domain-containing protein [Polycladomyces subterraneus]|uniref:DUF4395 domain-containing protein n=1 Tax=Polycladomyces subterraneus TaxID=1016997 RepID=A0ABT8IRA2_9BACL|nr:DUF4395 domain-containing protein [Polycladomyces subterraneus]MDN4595325.1 DUF4395 domain-containing protein [Polycladomyces subterraneus]